MNKDVSGLSPREVVRVARADQSLKALSRMRAKLKERGANEDELAVWDALALLAQRQSAEVSAFIIRKLKTEPYDSVGNPYDPCEILPSIPGGNFIGGGFPLPLDGEGEGVGGDTSFDPPPPSRVPYLGVPPHTDDLLRAFLPMPADYNTYPEAPSAPDTASWREVIDEVLLEPNDDEPTEPRSNRPEWFDDWKMRNGCLTILDLRSWIRTWEMRPKDAAVALAVTEIRVRNLLVRPDADLLPMDISRKVSALRRRGRDEVVGKVALKQKGLKKVRLIIQRGRRAMLEANHYGMDPADMITFRHWGRAQVERWKVLNKARSPGARPVRWTVKDGSTPGGIPSWREPAGCTVIHGPTRVHVMEDSLQTFRANRRAAENKLAGLVRQHNDLEELRSIRHQPPPNYQDPDEYLAELKRRIDLVVNNK